MSERTHWLDRPGLSRRLWTAYAIVLAALLAIELTVEHHHVGLMGSLGFHAWFGLLVGGLSIAVSKAWKAAFKRKDGYYD